MKKVSCITFAFLLFCTSIFAQFKKHEFTVWNGVGMGTLHPHLKIKENKFQFVENFGGDYCFSFTEHWGIGAGVEFNYYNSNFLVVSNFVYPGTKDIYHVRYRYMKNNIPDQDISFISIPLFTRFQTGKTNQFLMALGGKMAIPLSSNHIVTELIGYALPPDPLSHFVPEDIVSITTSYKLGFLFSAECGAKWNLSSLLTAHTLLYVDYGLNDIIKHRTTPYYFVDVRYEDIKVNDNKKMIPMQIGIKVKLGFNK